jgi:hypothetical protein
MCANLCHATEDRPADAPLNQTLAGTLVSSLHRLKDVDNTDGGFFVFGDLSVKVEGEFRLCFSLFEISQYQVTHLQAIKSKVFKVYSSKEFPGMADSTILSRSFGDQGVRIRIRKERRMQLKRGVATIGSDRESSTLSSYNAEAERSGMTTTFDASQQNLNALKRTRFADEPALNQRFGTGTMDRDRNWAAFGDYTSPSYSGLGLQSTVPSPSYSAYPTPQTVYRFDPSNSNSYNQEVQGQVIAPPYNYVQLSTGNDSDSSKTGSQHSTSHPSPAYSLPNLQQIPAGICIQLPPPRASTYGRDGLRPVGPPTSFDLASQQRRNSVTD